MGNKPLTRDLLSHISHFSQGKEWAQTGSLAKLFVRASARVFREPAEKDDLAIVRRSDFSSEAEFNAALDALHDRTHVVLIVHGPDLGMIRRSADGAGHA